MGKSGNKENVHATRCEAGNVRPEVVLEKLADDGLLLLLGHGSEDRAFREEP